MDLNDAVIPELCALILDYMNDRKFLTRGNKEYGAFTPVFQEGPALDPLNHKYGTIELERLMDRVEEMEFGKLLSLIRKKLLRKRVGFCCESLYTDNMVILYSAGSADRNIQRYDAKWISKVIKHRCNSNELSLMLSMNLGPLVNANLGFWLGYIKRAADDDTIDLTYEDIEIPLCVEIIFCGIAVRIGVGYAQNHIQLNIYFGCEWERALDDRKKIH